VRVANHDLILWLDEPGRGLRSLPLYKKISFCGCEAVCVLEMGVPFSGRADSHRPRKRARSGTEELCHKNEGPPVIE